MEKNGQFSPMNLPIAFMVTFHSYVSLPIGVSTMRVYIYIWSYMVTLYIYMCISQKMSEHRAPPTSIELIIILPIQITICRYI